jgi:hypothetical protein
MKKSQVISHVLAAAEQVRDNPGSPDLNSWEKWTAATLRNVFYEEEQHTHAQSLENIMRRVIHLALNNLDYQAEIQEWIEIAQNVTYAEGTIIYQPPFDLTTRHY